MILNLINSRKDILFHYSPYSFFPKADKIKILENTIIKNIDESLNDNSIEAVNINILGKEHVFIVKFLKWDSDYFNLSTHRLLFVLYDHKDYEVLKKQLIFLLKTFL